MLRSMTYKKLNEIWEATLDSYNSNQSPPLDVFHVFREVLRLKQIKSKKKKLLIEKDKETCGGKSDAK